MEQKILDRLNSAANEINELGQKRESLIKELRNIDMNMEVLSAVIYELKSLLETKEWYETRKTGRRKTTSYTRKAI